MDILNHSDFDENLSDVLRFYFFWVTISQNQEKQQLLTFGICILHKWFNTLIITFFFYSSVSPNLWNAIIHMWNRFLYEIAGLLRPFCIASLNDGFNGNTDDFRQSAFEEWFITVYLIKFRSGVMCIDGSPFTFPYPITAWEMWTLTAEHVSNITFVEIIISIYEVILFFSWENYYYYLFIIC